MGLNHIAITTNDLEVTHRFYTEVMGFELVKVVVARNGEHGWARHVFYSTGEARSGLFAVWDFHDPALPGFDPAISTGLGLPTHANHIAFDASDLDDLSTKLARWRERGVEAWQIDHGWCTSIYTMDPNGIMVEFCCVTADFTSADRDAAVERLTAEAPTLDPDPPIEFFPARDVVADDLGAPAG